MLFVFAGIPQTRLTAGGLQHAVETVEELGLLEHDQTIQYRKEGVFLVLPEAEEKLRDTHYYLSDNCLRAGITWKWFPENWSFGNGVTVHKTMAFYETRVVVHGTEQALDEYLKRRGPTRLADIELENKHIITEGWEKYEARWLPGTCPQENHIVHLTWLIAKYPLPPFAYHRLREIIEVPGTTLISPERYEQKHFSEWRVWDGKPYYHVRA